MSITELIILHENLSKSYSALISQAEYERCYPVLGPTLHIVGLLFLYLLENNENRAGFIWFQNVKKKKQCGKA